MSTAVRGCLAVLLLAAAGCGGSTAKKPSLDQQYQQALKIANHETRAIRLVDIASRQMRDGSELGADKMLDAAALAAEAIEAPAGRVSALMKVFALKAQLGFALAAQDLLREAERAVEELQRPEEKLPWLVELAIAYGRDLDRPSMARLQLKQAEQIAAELDSGKSQITARLQLARAYAETGEAERAQQLIDDALADTRQLEGRDRTESLGEAAQVLSQLGRQEQSQQLLEEAEQSAAAIEDPLSRAHALLQLGRKSALGGHKQKASRLLRQASDVAHDVKDSTMRGPLLEQISAAQREL